MCLGGLTAFQVSLAAGAPFGVVAYGGAAHGVLPPSLRATSAVAAIVWGSATAAIVTGRPRSRSAQRAMYTALAGVAAAGSAVNLASPSLPERLLWVPVSVLLAATAWHQARSLGPTRVAA